MISDWKDANCPVNTQLLSGGKILKSAIGLFLYGSIDTIFMAVC